MRNQGDTATGHTTLILRILEKTGRPMTNQELSEWSGLPKSQIAKILYNQRGRLPAQVEKIDYTEGGEAIQAHQYVGLEELPPLPDHLQKILDEGAANVGGPGEDHRPAAAEERATRAGTARRQSSAAGTRKKTGKTRGSRKKPAPSGAQAPSRKSSRKPAGAATGESPAPETPGADMEAIAESIHAHLDRPMTPAELATDLGYDENQISTAVGLLVTRGRASIDKILGDQVVSRSEAPAPSAAAAPSLEEEVLATFGKRGLPMASIVRKLAKKGYERERIQDAVANLHDRGALYVDRDSGATLYHPAESAPARAGTPAAPAAGAHLETLSPPPPAAEAVREPTPASTGAGSDEPPARRPRRARRQPPAAAAPPPEQPAPPRDEGPAAPQGEDLERVAARLTEILEQSSSAPRPADSGDPVSTLTDYVRQLEAEVETWRSFGAQLGSLLIDTLRKSR